jgi:hypothetical protein
MIDARQLRREDQMVLYHSGYTPRAPSLAKGY